MRSTQLRNYAEWYYTKYFPSKSMLREKLVSRCEDVQVVNEVMENLEPLIVEKQNIESRIHSFLSQGKTPRYIWQKMLQKKFDPEIIEQVLADKQDVIDNPETYRVQIEKLIEKGSRKGASKKSLQYELRMKYPDARDFIDELLYEYDDIEMLRKNVAGLLKKYSQEQVVARLSQKGFRVSDVMSVLRSR